MSDEKRCSLSVYSKSTLPDSGCQHTADAKSALNTQLLLNAAGHVCQPSDVLVPETLPQDFVEISDNSEIHNQPVGKTDDCSMTGTRVDFSAGSVEHDDNNAEVSGSTNQPSISSLETTCHGSPVFNRQCAAPVPVSSSPSLFDDEEEKHLFQKNMSKNLLLASGKKIAAKSCICTDVSQPSPSMLNRKLAVNASAHPENEQNMYNVNVVQRQPMILSSQLQSTGNDRDVWQTANKVNYEDGCYYTVKTKLTSVQSCTEMSPNGLDVRVNGADDRLPVCNIQMPDVSKVPAEAGQLANETDMQEVSATSLNVEQNDLLAVGVKLSRYQVASGNACSASHVTCEPSDCLQPLPKKRHYDALNSSMFLHGSSHAVNVDDHVEDNGKLLSFQT